MQLESYGAVHAPHASARSKQKLRRIAVINRKAHSMADQKLPEVPINSHDELLLWHALHRLDVTYWYDVDVNEGRAAHEFFTLEGMKIVGHNRLEGREQIRAFYKWRVRLSGTEAVRQLGISGLRAVRHLVTNLYVASSSERYAIVLGIAFSMWCIEASIKSPYGAGFHQ
jgi:hypothetical protein